MKPRWTRWFVGGVVVVVAGLGLVAVAPSVGAADVPATVVGERVDVSVVNVEVLVTASDGSVVSDLDAEDFQLLVDGQPMEIEYFDRPIVGRAAATPSESMPTGGTSPQSPVATPAGRHFVVFVDDIHSGPMYRGELLGQLYVTLEERLRPNDKVMVARYQRSGLEILQPFTGKKQKILEAFRTAAEVSTTRLVLEAADNRIFDTMYQQQQLEANNNRQGGRGTCVSIGGLAQDHAATVFGRVGVAVSALDTLVKSLASVPGRKTLLHVSDGIPLIAGGEALTYAIEMCDGTAEALGFEDAENVQAMGDAQRHRWDPFGARLQIHEFDTTRLWQEVTASANANQVAIYTVRSTGLAATGSTTIRLPPGTEQLVRRNPEGPLFLMAEETGGTATVNTNDFGDALQAMVEDGDRHYVLTFSPPAPATGERREIDVLVDRPGVRVRARKSFLDKTPEARLVESVLSALFHEVEDNPLGASLALEQSTGETTKKQVTFRVALPLETLTLLPQGPMRHGLLHVFVGARGDDGSATGIRESTVPVLVDLDPAAGEDEFVYDVAMTLEAQPWRVAVALRDELGGTVSVLSKDVTIEP